MVICNLVRTCQPPPYFHFTPQLMFATSSPPPLSASHTDPSLLLVLSQFKPSKLVGHLQRLLQTMNVPACGLSRHVLAASLAVQKWAQLLNPLAGLQATIGHILKRGGGD